MDRLLLFTDGTIQILGWCLKCDQGVKVDLSMAEFAEAIANIPPDTNEAQMDLEFLKQFHISLPEEEGSG